MIARRTATCATRVISIECIQGCGGIQEEYEVREEAEMLKQLLLGAELALSGVGKEIIQ